MLLREEVIAEARTWLGTRFRYQGRVKKSKDNCGGVDCLGLILGVCDGVGYKYDGKPLSSYDNVVYSKKPDYSILKERFSKFFKIKGVWAIGVGDIVLKRVSKEQYHLMFYAGKTFIHASAVTFGVVEHDVDNLDNCIVYSMFE